MATVIASRRMPRSDSYTTAIADPDWERTTDDGANPIATAIVPAPAPTTSSPFPFSTPPSPAASVASSSSALPPPAPAADDRRRHFVTGNPIEVGSTVCTFGSGVGSDVWAPTHGVGSEVIGTAVGLLVGTERRHCLPPICSHGFCQRHPTLPSLARATFLWLCPCCAVGTGTVAARSEPSPSRSPEQPRPLSQSPLPP